MRLDWSLMILALVFDAVPGAAAQSVPAAGLSEVFGRIEILNSKITLRNGKPDAGGVVLWLTPVRGTPMAESAPAGKRKLEQQNKRFIPHVMAIQVGTEVNFPNKDPFFHNVFSLYDGKPFDLGLYANGESRSVRFDRPGISYVFCNIHPQMSAAIVTVATPYFAVSTPDGRYTIRNVPEGTYELRLWHERSDEQQLSARSRMVTVGSSVVDLGVIPLDEAGYVARTHLDKYGRSYRSDRDLPAYRRP